MVAQPTITLTAFAHFHYHIPRPIRLPIEMVQPLPLWEIFPDSGEAPQNELLPVPSGHVTLAKTKNHSLYSSDNEFGHHVSDVWDFSASRYLVSNRQYLAFVEDRGIRTRSLLDPGRLAVC